MKTFLIFITCCLVVSYGFLQREQSSPGTPPDRCLSENHKLGMMIVDEKKQVLGSCMIATCLEKGLILYEGCSSVGLPPNCKFVEPDPKAPFPNCCRYDYVC